MVQKFFDCSGPECQRPSARSVGAGCDICRRHFCSIHLSRDFHQCNAVVSQEGWNRDYRGSDYQIHLKDLNDADYKALMTAEIDCLRDQINEDAACKLASSLNGGKSCVLEYPSKVVGLDALTGCANYHARIRFEDGSASWLLRVPRVTGFAVGFPVPLAEYLIRSEFATLKFSETTDVPAPQAFSFEIPSEGNGTRDN